MELEQPIGILGGTFDPIHTGHIRVSLEILEKTPVNIIKLLPCYQPVHKKYLQASVQQRIAMIQAAIEKYPKLQLDRTEIDRGGPSFMIDTLITLRDALPSTPLCLILGQDAFSQLHTWKNWQDLFTFSHILVVNRPHVQPIYNAGLNEEYNTRRITDAIKLTKQLSGYILPLTIKPIPISATEVRARLQKGETIIDLVPHSVAKYIYDHHLYR